MATKQQQTVAVKTVTETVPVEAEGTVRMKSSTAPKVKAFFKKADVDAFSAYDVADDDWFVNAHQADDNDELSPLTAITLGDLLAAFKRSEELMEQFPVNPRTVYEVAKSLFVKGEQLKEAIAIGRLVNDEGNYTAGTMLGYGGRHRLAAIVEFINEFLRDSEDRAAVLEDTTILVLVRQVSSLERIKDLILSNNKSRNMTGLEKSHIQAQANLGIRAHGVAAADIAVVLNNADISKGERSDYLGMFFSRLQPKGLGLKGETAKNLGKKLFGFVADFEADSISHTGATYMLIAKDAWVGIKAILADYEEKNIARSVGAIVESYVDSDEFSDKLAKGAYIQKAAAKKQSKKVESITE